MATKLTPPQRRALAALTQGYVLIHSVVTGRAFVASRETLDYERINPSTEAALRERNWVSWSENDEGFRIYAITDAGRAALESEAD